MKIDIGVGVHTYKLVKVPPPPEVDAQGVTRFPKPKEVSSPDDLLYYQEQISKEEYAAVKKWCQCEAHIGMQSYFLPRFFFNGVDCLDWGWMQPDVRVSESLSSGRHSEGMLYRARHAIRTSDRAPSFSVGGSSTGSSPGGKFWTFIASMILAIFMFVTLCRK